MARLQDVLEAMMTGAVAQQAGRFQASQITQQRQQQEFEQRARAAEGLATQQGGLREMLARFTPQLDPDSRAVALGGMFNQPDPRAGLANDPYVTARPNLQAVYRQYGQPAAPAGQPALGPGQFRVPGIAQPLGINRVDPKEATRVMGVMDRALGDMRNITITDPRHTMLRDELFRQRAGLGQIQTPEQLQAANSLLQNVLGFQSQVGGPQAQRFQEQQVQSDITDYETEFEKGIQGLDDLAFASALPGHLQTERSIRERRGKRGYGGKGLEVNQEDVAEIERLLAAGDQEGAARLGKKIKGRYATKVTPSQESAAQRNALQILGKMNPRAVTPEVTRRVYANAGVGYLVEGLPDEALRMGGADLEKEWQKNFALLTTPNRWKGLPKEAREAALSEIAGIAALTGRKLDLPADMVLEMDEETRRKLAQRDDQLDLQGKTLDVRRAQLQFMRDKFAWQKQQKAKEEREGTVGKKGGLTENAKAQAYRKVWEKSWADYDRLSRELKTTTADFDPLKPDMRDSDQVALSRLYKAALSAGTQYKGYLKGQGVDIDVNIGEADTPAPAPAVAPQGKPGTPPGRPAATQQPARAGRFSGTLNGKQYQNVDKAALRAKLLQGGATEAEVNAIFRQMFPPK
jgi:hypothetical protein